MVQRSGGAGTHIAIKHSWAIKAIDVYEAAAGRIVHPLRLTWSNAAKNVAISLEGLNLANEYCYVTVFDLRGAGGGFDKGQPGRPRECALAFKKNF